MKIDVIDCIPLRYPGVKNLPERYVIMTEHQPRLRLTHRPRSSIPNRNIIIQFLSINPITEVVRRLVKDLVEPHSLASLREMGDPRLRVGSKTLWIGQAGTRVNCHAGWDLGRSVGEIYSSQADQGLGAYREDLVNEAVDRGPIPFSSLRRLVPVLARLRAGAPPIEESD